jgi:hypothetical protein
LVVIVLLAVRLTLTFAGFLRVLLRFAETLSIFPRPFVARTVVTAPTAAAVTGAINDDIGLYEVDIIL